MLDIPLEQLAAKDLFIIEQSPHGILYQTILNFANQLNQFKRPLELGLSRNFCLYSLYT